MVEIEDNEILDFVNQFFKTTLVKTDFINETEKRSTEYLLDDTDIIMTIHIVGDNVTLINFKKWANGITKNQESLTLDISNGNIVRFKSSDNQGYDEILNPCYKTSNQIGVSYTKDFVTSYIKYFLGEIYPSVIREKAIEKIIT